MAQAAAQSSSSSNSGPLISIAELQSAVLEQNAAPRAWRIEAVVRALIRERNIVAVQDDSGALLLELPSLPAALASGCRVAVEGSKCRFNGSCQGICLGPALALDYEGESRVGANIGSVFLDAGFQPVRIECFNAGTNSELGLEYQGPGMQRQKIPDALIWHDVTSANGQIDFRPGLNFNAYGMSGLEQPADLQEQSLLAEGVVTTLELPSLHHSMPTALSFSGYLKIPRDGLYTFYLPVGQRCRLCIGAMSCVASGPGSPLAPPKTLEAALTEARNHQWVEVEGDVAFAGSDGRKMQLVLIVARRQVPLTVVDYGQLQSTNLLHQRLQVTGICELPSAGVEQPVASVIVPSSEQIKIQSPKLDMQMSSSHRVLTTAAQVRRLRPEEAGLGIAAKIRGVVIAAEHDSLVLQDASGGVYIHFDARGLATAPDCGELWDIDAKRDPGDFSPVLFASKGRFIGRAAMPEPIRPTWDQLMNGSLDAEYVELHGVLTAVSTNAMILLTPDGKVKVQGDNERPLPWVPLGSGVAPAAGSVVRLRGCLTADWNWQTRQVIGGQFNLYPGVVEVEESPPSEPFSLPTRKTAELLGFDARASALQRTKLAGQIIHWQPGEYFVLDGQTGVRVLADPSLPLRTGDLIEAVGFPRFGAPSPVLQEARLRKTGHASLPNPVPLAPDGLLEPHQDSTWVQVDATLLSDTFHPNQRVLELQAGPHRFAAILNSDPRTWQHLKPGSRLRVTGAYSTANESYAGANLAPFELLLNNAAGILVLHQPPWWTVQRAIAVAAVLSCILGLAFIWITLLRRQVEERTSQLQREIEARRVVEQKRVLERERTRVAQDLHDELGAGLTEVGILGELAKNPAVPLDEKEQYLGQLITSARALVGGLDEIVWAVNPQYDSLSSLATYCSFFADRFLKPAGIACRLRVAESLPDSPLDSKARHSLFLAFKEALNNVVRHAGASEVELTIEVAEGELSIRIRDNGRGLPAAMPPASDGLSGMRKRLEQLGGSCDITSQAGRGTTIWLRLPIASPTAMPANSL